MSFQYQSIILKLVFTAALTSAVLTLSSCDGGSGAAAAQQNRLQQAIQSQALSTFNEPWAMAQLPDGRLLVTEKSGQLQLFDPKTQQKSQVTGTPNVAYGGQGGLGDIILHPNFKNNQTVYFSYIEAGKGGFGAVAASAKLDLTRTPPVLSQVKTIWQQLPKVEGQGHYSHRLAFDAQGKLWISSGERQLFDPAQDMQSNLGKILRLNEDGSAVADNPFAAQGGVTAQIWSLGHRNPLGMAFDPQGRLWVAEMGPEGGDELNLIEKGANYGYPIVSNGNHYGGKDIPDHSTRPEFAAPKVSWTPVISPSSLIFYTGTQLSQWTGKAIIAGLSSKALIVVDTTQNPVQEVQRVPMGQRIRVVQQAPDGGLWLLEDGAQGRLLRVSAKPDLKTD